MTTPEKLRKTEADEVTNPSLAIETRVGSDAVRVEVIFPAAFLELERGKIAKVIGENDGLENVDVRTSS